MTETCTKALLFAIFFVVPIDCAIHQGCATTDSSGVFEGRIADRTAVCAAGASLPNALYQLTTFAFSRFGSASYTATGSTTGKESVQYNTVDFAGSDSLLKDSQYEHSPDLQMYPAVGAAVVPVYNLPALDAAGLTLVLDRIVLPKIFMGDIYKWDHPEVLALQSVEAQAILGALADKDIKVVVRDDGSGTTEILTKSLSLFSERTGGDFHTRIGGDDVIDWCEDGMEDIPCPTTIGGDDNCKPSSDDGTCYTDGTCNTNTSKKNCFGSKNECEGISWVVGSAGSMFKTQGKVTCQKPIHGNRTWSYFRGYKTAGMVATVFSLTGSLGYSVLADALASDLKPASMINSAGTLVVPTADAVSWALMELGGNLDERGNADLMDAPATFAWPMAAYTYYVLSKGKDAQGVDHMVSQPEMFDCTTRENTMAYLEWFYASETVQELAKGLGFTPLPPFIAETIINKMLTENYCFNTTSKGVQLAKAPKELDTRYISTPELPASLLELYGSVYREVEPQEMWLTSVTKSKAQQLMSDLSVSEEGLGVSALDSTDDVPTDILAAPLFVIGVVPQYHIGSTSDLELTLEQIADIYLGTITTWDMVRSDLPAEDIKVLVRTDESETVQIITDVLSTASSAYAAAIGRKRLFAAADYAALGDRAILAASNTQVQAAIAFNDNSIGLWEHLSKKASKLATVKRTASSEAIALSKASLSACQNTTSELHITSASGKVSTVYANDKLAQIDGCWPIARSYSLIIKEGLAGASQCLPGDTIVGNGPSAALSLARWLNTGDKVTSAVERAGAAAAPLASRAAFVELLKFDCNPTERSAGLSIWLLVGIGCGALVVFTLIVLIARRQLKKAKKEMNDLVHLMNAKLPENVQEVIEKIHSEQKDNKAGTIPDYIPELFQLGTYEQFGICLCDLEGNIYKVGDANHKHTVQSVGKVLMYAAALEVSEAEASKRVGDEPSGCAFDVCVIDSKKRASNPYINCGAIVTCGIVESAGTDCYEKFEALQKACAEDPSRLGLNESVYKSEMSCNTTNQATAKLLKDKGVLPDGITAQQALDVYTKCCSLDTTASDIAVQAATLANKGVNPLTGATVLDKERCEDMNTKLMSCGMYNGAGKWMVDVGIPAKSGVGGLLMCVVPGVCGIGISSPPLDECGNPERAVAVAKAMSAELGLHVLKKDDAPASRSPSPNKVRGPSPNKYKVASVMPAEN